MRLFKNVDICNLESIINRGILSMDACGNNNWEDGKRGDNPTDVVYLFQPLGKQNSFVQYGAALLEVEIDHAEISELAENDVNKGKYIEYVVDHVLPEAIKHIYIPAIFKDRPDVSISDSRIVWCGFSADEVAGYCPGDGPYGFDGTVIYKKISKKRLEQFAKTAKIVSHGYLFFKGIDADRALIELYNVVYEM